MGLGLLLVFFGLIVAKILARGEEVRPIGMPEEWLPASSEDISKYGSLTCNIPRLSIANITHEKFEELKGEPFIIEFENGVFDWCNESMWNVLSLVSTYGNRFLSTGKSIDIVYKGGHGSSNMTFAQFIAEMRSDASHKDLTYLFDRKFYWDSNLPSSIKPPSFLFNKGDPILFIGGTGTGATFHKHMPAWNGVIHGAKRWFLYPVETTPPGGMYSCTAESWFEYIYPNLKDELRPLECVQKAGDIFYVPESYYHAVLNIGETVAISLQEQQVSTHMEKLFYQAMNTHYNSTICEYEHAQAWRDKAWDYYLDLHWKLPRNTEILQHLADIACESGLHARCELILNLIIEMDPYASEVRLIRSKIYYDRADYDSCEKELLVGLEHNPTSHSLLKEYGNFLWSRRKQESKRIYERLYAAMDPGTTDAINVKTVLDTMDFTIPESPLPQGPLGPLGDHDEL